MPWGALMFEGPEVSAKLRSDVDAVLTLFNRRSLDLPDGFFDRRTQFVLNGVAYEETLGRSPSDPLVLMIARGPAGYRFICKALQHAVPDATLERGELGAAEEGGRAIVRGRCWLSGHLRGTVERCDTVVDVALHLHPDLTVVRAEAHVEEAVLSRLREARLRS